MRHLSPILTRYVSMQFVRTFVLTLLAFIAISLIADFFDRFGEFLHHDAPAGAIVRYFLFKLPLVVTQVTPFAVLVAVLGGLGLLARHNEFVALRACGVSIWQIVVPLLTLGSILSVGVLYWNDSVVPYCARRWHDIESREIKKKQSGLTMFAGRRVWYHGGAGFYDINRVNNRRRTLVGLTVYQVDEEFTLRRIIEADTATWDGAGWLLVAPRTHEFTPEGVREYTQTPAGFSLPESFDDFLVIYVDPESFSYGMLQQQIDDMRRKGIDASETLVDLHLKLALPAASFVMMLLAVPLAVRGTRVTSVWSGVGLGFGLGFAYFVVLASSRALGQTGALPPFAAAWAANSVFLLVGTYYLLGTE